ncbi:DegT/DnrJ/EryC1/StrS aminotransferase family protein [Pelagibius sp.]|uniref:DegT/DnrJ/EryC1/StrS family aminotransferase n=1 Tax=Pelagibius sp. TaxID=1931238 RepID=UPI0026096BD7|nr:aminotransferase class I/II-fold pyridoxal phosphate-dependent enzyme [Pelagibius sp.]
MKRFTKSFTQQEPISETAVERAVAVMRSGRLHRYNIDPGEISEVAALEEEYAAFQGIRYCLACASGGYGMQVALRAAGVKPGDKVLANAYTLAPVPGAIHSIGGRAVLVEIDDHYHIDLGDLGRKAEASGARILLLSHMRGHIADMDRLMAVCDKFGVTVIEDCAHTMGGRWRGTRSGNFGKVACFSTQTYKHINSGEGGFITTDDPELAARAVVLSGSYMLYGRNGAIPDEEVFHRVRLDVPNCSGRMDNLRAAILRPQLAALDEAVERWNARYDLLAEGFRAVPGLRVPARDPREHYVGSSIQFFAEGLRREAIPQFLENCAARGVELKWFGDAEPKGFTSRYDSWRYLGEQPDLPQTLAVLDKTCDMRVPLTFDLDDCRLIVEIVGEEVARLRSDQAA